MRLLILILFLPSLLFSSDFSKISSLNFDLVGVVASGYKISAYGTRGSVYYSDDDAQSWEVIKPFPEGNIVNFFIESDRLIAFLQTGEVSQSYDNGLNWSVTKPIDDSVAYVIKGNDDYYVRAQSAIFKLSKNLIISKSNQYPYYYGFDITYHYSPTNRMQMSYLDNKLFVLNHYMNAILVLDEDLNKIDSVDISKKLLDSSTIFISKLTNTTEDLVIRLHNYNVDSTFIYKLDPDLTKLDVLLNLSESREQQGKIFSEISPIVYNFNLYKDKLYTFNPFSVDFFKKPYYNVFELISKDSAAYKGVIDANVVIPLDVLKSFTINDFVIENERITGISKNNLIVTKKINSESTDRVSNLVGSGNSSNLFQINDSDFLLFATKNIYRSYDTTKTFKKVMGDSAVYSYLNIGTKFYHFNQKNDKLLYFNFAKYNSDSSLVYISEDYGSTFKIKLLEDVDFRTNYKNYRILNDEDNYIISETNVLPSRYIIYDKEFNFLSSKIDSSYRYDYFFGEDLTNFTFLGATIEDTDKNKYLKSTTDGGKTWNDLRTFSFVGDTIWYYDSTQFIISATSDLRYNKSIDNNGSPYIFFVTYNTVDSLYKIEAMDLQTNEFNLIYQNKQGSYSNTIVELIDGTYYICKDDTLFTTSNLFDYNSWQGQKLPNNGTMLNRIMKSGDYLITYYFDDIHPYDIYRIKWNELSITSITEEDIEVPPYFYNSAPFPLPTSTYVSTKVYMDNNVAITKESIKIYDINGTQVENGNKVEISNTVWPTTLTWDSSNQPPGVYFILIEYDGNSKAIKVMKE
ncbi:MAG: T9SS type A sorting domain-containing protein [Candidatus Kapaibacterium sp.]